MNYIFGCLALVTRRKHRGRTIARYNLHLERKGDDALRYSQFEEALHDARRYDWDTPILLAGDLISICPGYLLRPPETFTENSLQYLARADLNWLYPIPGGVSRSV